MSDPIKLRRVPSGRRRGSLLAFLHSRIVRHEIVNGMSVALLPFQIQPDKFIPRTAKLTPEEITALSAEYLLVQNGALTTYVDSAGGSYLAVGVAKVGGT